MGSTSEDRGGNGVPTQFGRCGSSCTLVPEVSFPPWQTISKESSLSNTSCKWRGRTPYLEVRGHKVVALDWSSIPSTNYRKNLRADGTSQGKGVRWMLFVL